MARTTEEVQIIVSAKDEATKALSGIGQAMATAVGTFVGGAALKGVDALFGAISGGVSDARDAAVVFAQTQAVIESTGGAAGFTAEQIADMAGSLSAASGKSLFGDDDIERGQNMLLTFTNIKETLPDTTQVMLDMAQALGTDAGGAAVQLGKALNDPIQGISALSRVGVSFTDQQKEQIKTMQEAGDMAGAQGVILAELNKEFGGSALAAAEADGGMAQLTDSMGELAESIGAELLPMITQFVQWLNSPDIQAGITTIATGLVGAIKAAATTFGEMMVAMQPVVDFVRANMTPILAALAAMLVTVVVPAFLAWAATAATAATATIVALAPVLLPIAAIGAAVGLLVAAWDRDWGGMRTTLTAWWTGTVQPILTTIKAWLDTHLPAANAALQEAWATAWSAIKAAISTAWSFMRDSVFPALKAAIDGIGTVIGTLQSAWSTAWGAISSVVSGAYGTISRIIDSIKSLIAGAIARINELIALINSIPGIELPSIPNPGGGGGGGGGGGSGAGLSVNSTASGPDGDGGDTRWSGQSYGGMRLTIVQTFGDGTPAAVRKQARLGATQGVRAAARSQGLI